MLRALVGAHRAQEADVAIPAVAALERQAGGGYLEHFDLFLARLENAGLHGLTIVHSIAEWNVGFYGVGYIPNGTDD